MNRIQNTIENGGIKKISFSPITQGSSFDNIFARYEKITTFNNQSTKKEYVEAMPSESKMGTFGFFYSGKKAGGFEYTFDGKVREEPKVEKSEVWF